MCLQHLQKHTYFKDSRTAALSSGVLSQPSHYQQDGGILPIV